jgi:hypothetical protein
MSQIQGGEENGHQGIFAQTRRNKNFKRLLPK